MTNKLIDAIKLIEQLNLIKSSFGDVFYAKQYADGVEQAIGTVSAMLEASPPTDTVKDNYNARLLETLRTTNYHMRNGTTLDIGEVISAVETSIKQIDAQKADAENMIEGEDKLVKLVADFVEGKQESSEEVGDGTCVTSWELYECESANGDEVSKPRLEFHAVQNEEVTISMAEHDALVADKERLDWFEKEKPTVCHYITLKGLFFGVDISTDQGDKVARDKSIRQAIDEARGK